MSTQGLIGYQEASEMLGLPVGTLYAMVSRKQIDHVRLGKRLVRFSVEVLENFINQKSVPAQSRDIKKYEVPKH
jgi:excisionase family DNA binding protein